MISSALSSFKAFAKRCGWVVLPASLVFTVTGFFGDTVVSNFSWLLDLTSHFRPQYAALQALAISAFIVRIIRKHRLRSVYLLGPLVCAAFILNMMQIWPQLQALPLNAERLAAQNTSSSEAVQEGARTVQGAARATQKAATLKLLHLNVFVLNRDHEPTLKLLQETDADVVSIQESWRDWPEALKPVLDAKYPYQLIHSPSGNGLYSRYPFETAEILPIERSVKSSVIGNVLGKNEGGILLAKLRLSRQPNSKPNGSPSVWVAACHPPVPVTPAYIQGYQRYLAAYQKVADQTAGEPLILVGDLNTTPWSAFYRKTVATLNLIDLRNRGRLRPTWPGLMAPVGLPIDHVLATAGITPLAQHSGPFVGSDHLPVYITLEISAKP